MALQCPQRPVLGLPRCARQPAIHALCLPFNWAGKPWLTQKWSRSIIERYYGSGQANAYLGDEDQGQMSAWLVMASLGLFQTDGGCSTNPVYEIASPLLRKVCDSFGRTIRKREAIHHSGAGCFRKNIYVQRATLNGQPLQTFHFPAAELLKGGSLILEMGPQPNKMWGIE